MCLGGSTTVLRRVTRGNALCGANNICNRLDYSRPVRSGRSHSEQAAVLHLSAASQASAIEAASDSPAPTLGRPHPSRQTRFALTNPNGRQVVRLRTGDNGCRVRSLRSGAHCGPIPPLRVYPHRPITKKHQIRSSTPSPHLFVREQPDPTTKQHFQHATSRTAVMQLRENNSQ